MIRKHRTLKETIAHNKVMSLNGVNKDAVGKSLNMVSFTYLGNEIKDAISSQRKPFFT